MNHKPMTDEEIAIGNLIPDGSTCFAEVLEATDHTSNAGKESIKLKLQIWEGEIRKGIVFVYLTPAFAMLYKHACFAMLTQEIYESGTIAADNYVGKSCDVVIGVHKDKSGTFPPKNVIKDFVKSDRQSSSDLPF